MSIIDVDKTALHTASKNNDLREIERLINLEADVKEIYNRVKTTLHYAAESNRAASHLNFIEVILNNGADVNAEDSTNKSPLHYLVGKSDVKTVKVLLKYGADVNLKDNFGNIPLNIAVKAGNDEVVRLLIDHGSDVNNISMLGQSTPLHLACIFCDIKTVKCLLNKGANLNAFNIHGCKPLDILVLSFNQERLKSFECLLTFLLKYTDVNVIHSSGRNIITYQLHEDQWKLFLKHVAMLQASGISINPIVIKIIEDRNNYRNYFQECKNELYLARSTKVDNCWVTAFNLLVDNKTKLKNYAGNRDFVDYFKGSGSLDKFPIYGAYMKKNLDKGIERREYFDHSAEVLSYCLPNFSPTHLVIKDILDCLTLKDYFKLVVKIL